MIVKTSYVSTNTNFTESFKDFKWKVGETIPIYTDFRNGRGLLGIAIIKEFLEEVDAKQTFIRKEMPSDKQEVWAPRKTKLHVVGINNKGLSHNIVGGTAIIRNIAHPYRIGISSSKYKKVKAIDKYPRMRMDNFELVPGWGQCF